MDTMTGPEEPDHGDQPAGEAPGAGTVTQQDQALEDEMERLLDENEDLRVWNFLFYTFYYNPMINTSWSETCR